MTFAERVGWVCLTHKASVTSWWRSVRHNANVGGVANSKHLHGEAVDVVYDGPPPPTSALVAMGLRVTRESDHDHLEEAPAARPTPP